MVDEQINNCASIFTPGYYKTRNGQKAEMLAQRENRLYGRIYFDNESIMRSEKMGYLKIPPYWKASSWTVEGSANHDPDCLPTNFDLIEPWGDNND